MGPWQRCPSPSPPNSSDAGRWVRAGCGAVSVAIPLAMLLAGTAGNALAMALVSRAYRARAARRRRSFLLCIGSLALTDLLGQLLTAPIVIAVYLSGGAWEALDPSGRLCAFFGGSMTAFGLCPLLTASAMAAERALAARAPHWYASRVSARAARRALLAIWAAALGLALLPLLGVGHYSLQWPGTWCFIAIGTAAGTSNAFPAAFALLGLGALLVTAACNLATIEALLARCRHRAGPRWGRVTAESLAQLLGIMCVLAACWAPLLITMLKMSWGHTFEHCRVVPTPAPGSEPPGECSFFLTAVRLASLNQILDPWVYLLLRKILLQRFCQAASAVSKCSNTECKQRSITLSEEIRRTAV